MEIRKFAQDKLLPPSAQVPQQTPSVQAQAQTKGVMTPMKLNETKPTHPYNVSKRSFSLLNSSIGVFTCEDTKIRNYF